MRKTASRQALSTILVKGFFLVVVMGALALGAQAAIYHVATPAAGGDDSNTGSEESPYATIGKAISEAQTEGDEIVVADGVYFEKNLTLDRKVTLRSVNGAEIAIIDTGNAGSGFGVTVSGGGTVRGFTIRNLNSTSRLVILSNNSTLESCVVTDAKKGGGVSCSGGSVVRRCRIEGNTLTAQSGGGGLFVEGGADNRCLIDACVISGNKQTTGNSSARGGGISAKNTDIHNSLIVGNENKWTGGGVFCDGGVTLDNCTVVDNSCLYSGVNVRITSSAGTILRNCIVVSSEDKKEILFIENSGKATITSCCITSLNSAPSNITSSNATATDILSDAPGFLSASTGDYRLADDSPCVNAGAELDWHTGATELDGFARVTDGVVDLGCYEFDRARMSFVCKFAAAMLDIGIHEVGFTATINGAMDGAEISAVWDFGDGTPATTGGMDVSHRFPCPGSFTVTLTVTEGEGSSERSCVYSREVVVVGRRLYVAAGSQTPVAPYDSWETAANRIDDALALAISGCTVVVADGDYSIEEKSLTVSSGVTLCSVNGPENAVIGARKFAWGNLDKIVVVGGTVRGFTIQGSSSGQRCVVLRDGAVLENCVVSGNANGGVDCTGGSVVRGCRIANNQGGSGAGISVDDGLIDRCVVSGNTNGNKNNGAGIYARNAVIRNTLVIRNASTYRGAGIYCHGGGSDATVWIENCTVADNSCTYSGPGIRVDESGHAVVLNCVSACNTSTGGSNYYGDIVGQDGCVVEVSNSCWLTGYGLTDCGGNLNEDPLFADAAAGDYRLAVGSPCLNAGAALDWHLGATDLNGRARVVGRAVDLGCYEAKARATLIIVR